MMMIGGITSHTLSSNLYYEWTQKLTTGLGVRYYMQSAADFYSARADYFTTQRYASSDRRVSEYDSYHYSVNVDYKVTDMVSVNALVGYYEQPDYFDSSYYGLGFKYKF